MAHPYPQPNLSSQAHAHTQQTGYSSAESMQHYQQQPHHPSHGQQMPSLPPVTQHYIPPMQQGGQYAPPPHMQQHPQMMYAQPPQQQHPQQHQQQQQQQQQQQPQQQPNAMVAPNPMAVQSGRQQNLDGLGIINKRDGLRYTLIVEQGPLRARMCGFGDKDRRPITPPPCIRLCITDPKTGEEILDYSEIDSQFMVLNVDLWDKDGRHEVNLVRSQQGAPSVSISNSTPVSYPPPPEVVYSRQELPPGGLITPFPGAAPIPAAHYMAGQWAGPRTPGVYPPQGAPAMFNPGAQPQGIPQTGGTTGMYTRNLIGSLSVNAFKLKDPKSKVGLWFILQDLSVRTEGCFRLKMNFVDVGDGKGGLNQGRAPVLAYNFTDAFQVYSAKKFPGVVESTELSRCFAQQGIKIPIRKDGPKNISNREEYEADDQ